MPKAQHISPDSSVRLDKAQLLLMHCPDTKSQLDNQNKIAGHLWENMNRSDKALDSERLRNSNDLAGRAKIRYCIPSFPGNNDQPHKVCKTSSSPEVEKNLRHTT